MLTKELVHGLGAPGEKLLCLLGYQTQEPFIYQVAGNSESSAKTAGENWVGTGATVSAYGLESRDIKISTMNSFFPET